MNPTHLDEYEYECDPITLENLNELEENEKITINGKIYSIPMIYEWVIERTQNKDPLRKDVSYEDKNRLIEE